MKRFHNIAQKKRMIPAMAVLIVLLFVALFRSFLANNIPLYAVLEGKTRFPVLEKIGTDWGILSPKAELNQTEHWQQADKAVWPPVRYTSSETDRLNDRFQKPHALRNDVPAGSPHYLGTDGLGHDVAAILIHGTGYSFFIGVFSMGLASLLGILLGALAGFWGDSRYKKNLPSLLWTGVGIFALWFYGVQIHVHSLSEGMQAGGIAFLKPLFFMLISISGLLIFFHFTGKWINRIPPKKKIAVGVDFIISRLIETMTVIPKLILILAFAALAKPSLWLPTLIIGLTSWPAVARFTRAEMLHVRSMDYMTAAETFGISNFRLFFVHALPNSLGPVPSLIAFGIAGAILAESTLSFLGIGIPPEIFTWGKLLAQGRSNPDAWWVTVLPGLMIFITISCFHRLGEYAQSDNRQKRRFIEYFR
ncbi:MAG: ABC transporter permease [Flavobacteriales bacterium]|nr:ABC transporter permease [Flavobacteriales bacterium]